MNLVRSELEWIWRNKPCMRPNHKLGFKVLNSEVKERGGFWYVEGLNVLVMVQGKRYPSWRNPNFKFRRLRWDRLSRKILRRFGIPLPEPRKRKINPDTKTKNNVLTFSSV